ncbi:hypothetical protein ABZT06_28685 [Streptomyces sp. NPDC005483]|uniref:hypothetical protein n=1 Tax=Streptomyces sp. NPDC005483 TaxID=3154882 RepID=UPI0033A3736A
MPSGQELPPPPGPEWETVCRICGHDDDPEPFWESGWPNEGAICPCCGNEPSVNDVSVPALREKRGHWLGQGAPWDSPSFRPKDWDILQQVEHIPAEWR